MQYDPFFDLFEHFRTEVPAWWHRAAAWTHRRRAEAVTSVDLALAATEEDDWILYFFCTYSACRLSADLLLSTGRDLSRAEDVAPACGGVLRPVLWPISVELSRAIERFISLLAVHGTSCYLVGEAYLFVYALLTCDETWLARVFQALDVDRRAGELLLKEKIFVPDSAEAFFDRLAKIFPWDRPLGDFFFPPELRDEPEWESLSPDEQYERTSLWTLGYLKKQIQRHFVPVDSAQPVPGMVVHFVDGDFEDIAVYAGEGEWWSLQYQELRLESTFAGASKTFYVRKKE